MNKVDLVESERRSFCWKLSGLCRLRAASGTDFRSVAISLAPSTTRTVSGMHVAQDGPTSLTVKIGSSASVGYCTSAPKVLVVQPVRGPLHEDIECLCIYPDILTGGPLL